MNGQQILEFIQEGTLFGLTECDIKVPEHWKDYFSKMTPIFKNIDVSVEDIGEAMKKHL